MSIKITSTYPGYNIGMGEGLREKARYRNLTAIDMSEIGANARAIILVATDARATTRLIRMKSRACFAARLEHLYEREQRC